MQLSCGRVNKIQGEINYIYNLGTGLNDYATQPELQAKVKNTVISMKRYDCDKEFDQKMKNLP